MKLRKTLTIGGETYPIVQNDVRLFLQAPGRAMFVIQASAAVSGLVRFSLGYSRQDRDQLFFTGYVDDSRTVDAKQQKIMCREVSAILLQKWPLALRHPTLQDVLQAYTDATGLEFIVPEKAYAETAVPCFQALGSGVHGLDSLGKVFGIEDYMWNQQADGRVFVGSWQNSRWATRPVAVNEKWFQKVGNTGNKQIAAVPALRPGVRLNGQYLTKLQLKEDEMVVTCSSRLSELF